MAPIYVEWLSPRDWRRYILASRIGLASFLGASVLRLFLFRGHQSNGSVLDWIDWLLWAVAIAIAVVALLVLYLLRRRGHAAYRAANSGTRTDLSLDVIYDTRGWSKQLREAVAAALSQVGEEPEWAKDDLRIDRKYEEVIDHLVRSHQIPD